MEFDTSDPSVIFNIDCIFAYASEMFPCMPMEVAEDRDILTVARDSLLGDYTLRDAVIWGNKFRFPPEQIDQDSLKFKQMGYNLPEFVRWKQSQIPHTRMSVDRLMSRWDRTDPDFDLLVEIARDGVKVMTDSDFIPNRLAPSRFSPNYDYAHTAINKALYDSYLSNLSIILTSADLARVPSEVPIHHSRLGLTLKKGKPQGRVTCNYTYGKLPSRLNTENVRIQAREYYGEIKNTTVQKLALMILSQVDRAKQLGRTSRDLILWKMDLKGAFTPSLSS